jgi:beta propeller repeat protein
MYDLSTHQETQISTSHAAMDPAIYGDRIVWIDRRSVNTPGLPGNVYMYNLSTHQETQISNGENAFLPQIYGNKIVWETETSGVPNDIYVYDLSTHQETHIKESEKDTNYSGVDYPDIYGDTVVWGEYCSGSVYGSRYICAYNMSTSQEFSTHENVIAQYCPAIYGDRIVWWRLIVDTYPNYGDIYLGTINAVLPVFPGCTYPPTDINNDGLYEDINGNERLDFADVVTYFNNMAWIPQSGLVTYFDYNRNGRIDFSDVVNLFNMKST